MLVSSETSAAGESFRSCCVTLTVIPPSDSDWDKPTVPKWLEKSLWIETGSSGTCFFLLTGVGVVDCESLAFVKLISSRIGLGVLLDDEPRNDSPERKEFGEDIVVYKEWVLQKPDWYT